MVDVDIVDTSSDTYKNERRLEIIEDRIMRLETVTSAILQGMKEAEKRIKELTKEVEKYGRNNSTVGGSTG